MAYSWLTRAVVIGLIAVFAFWGVGTGLSVSNSNSGGSWSLK
jgi:hypothetical protein